MNRVPFLLLAIYRASTIRCVYTLFASQRKFVRYRLHLHLRLLFSMSISLLIESLNACDIVLTAISKSIPFTMWFQFEIHSILDDLE